MGKDKNEKVKVYSLVVIAISCAIMAFQISMYIADITNALNNIAING